MSDYDYRFHFFAFRFWIIFQMIFISSFNIIIKLNILYLINKLHCKYILSTEVANISDMWPPLTLHLLWQLYYKCVSYSQTSYKYISLGRLSKHSTCPCDTYTISQVCFSHFFFFFYKTVRGVHSFIKGNLFTNWSYAF